MDRHEAPVVAIMSENATPEQAEATYLALSLARGELPPGAPSAEEDEIVLRTERTLHEQIVAVTRDACRSLSPEELRELTVDERGAISIGSYAIPVEHAVAAVTELR